MNWYIVDKKYINYLTQFDSHVGYVEYGERLKLHVGTLLTIGNFHYYVPISSAKPKHQKMSNSLDFHKLQDESTRYLYAVLNINNMIPVPDNCLTQLKYNQIDCFRSFKSDKEKTDYIYLLQKEKFLIDNIQNTLQNKAMKLYQKCIISWLCFAKYSEYCQSEYFAKQSHEIIPEVYCQTRFFPCRKMLQFQNVRRKVSFLFTYLTRQSVTFL